MHARVRELAYVYERALQVYHHDSSKRWCYRDPASSPSTYTLMTKMVELADTLGVTLEVYVEAQFYWFDKWFNRAPKIQELYRINTKFPTPKRIHEYLQLKIKKQVPQQVQCVARTFKADQVYVDEANRRRLEEVCRAWKLTEDEALDRFGAPGFGYFDPDWLKRHARCKKS